MDTYAATQAPGHPLSRRPIDDHGNEVGPSWVRLRQEDQDRAVEFLQQASLRPNHDQSNGEAA